jgi:hypothetical protein
MHRRHLALWAAALMCHTVVVPLCEAEQSGHAEDQKAFETAVFLLRRSTIIQTNGRHHLLQKALRQLHDPALAPLFGHMADSKKPDLQVHGMLGLAEAGARKRLDLVRVAAIESPAVQADLISHALDNDLLSDEQIQQMLEWTDGLDLAVKVLICARQLRDGKLGDLQLLREALTSKNAARRSLAALLLLQAGEPGAAEHLEKLNLEPEPERQRIRRMVVRTGLRFNFERIAPWAMGVASDPATEPPLDLLTLRAALKFAAPGAFDLWQKALESAPEPASRMRVALLALSLAHEADDDFNAVLSRNESDLIKQIGATSAAVHSGNAIAQQVIALLGADHPMFNEWALSFATRHASDDDAIAILEHLIQSFRGPKPRSDQQLDHVVTATRTLYNVDAGRARAFLRPILESPETPSRLKDGILFGLIGCPADSSAHEVIQGLPTFDRPRARSLAVLLLAKYNAQLGARKIRQLALILRGGGLSGPLRVQAAWRYLSLTGQAELALAQVLSP